MHPDLCTISPQCAAQIGAPYDSRSRLCPLLKKARKKTATGLDCDPGRLYQCTQSVEVGPSLQYATAPLCKGGCRQKARGFTRWMLPLPVSPPNTEAFSHGISPCLTACGNWPATGDGYHFAPERLLLFHQSLWQLFCDPTACGNWSATNVVSPKDMWQL